MTSISSPTLAKVDVFKVPPRWIFVQVTLTNGAAGWGEAMVSKRANAVCGAIQDLAENLLGSDASRIEDICQRMRKGGFFRDGPVLATAAAGIEMALWDLEGRARDMAVHRFLGGPVREQTRAYAWVGGDRPDKVVGEIGERLKQGFGAVKMNATGPLDYVDRHAAIEQVVARVAAVREEFGYDVEVALDFHGRVHRAMAKSLFRELEQFHLMWIEEPVASDDYDSLRLIADVAGGTPIATGERLTSRWQFKRLLNDGRVDIVQPDISITGLFELEKIARMAEAYDVAVAPHSPNGPISLAASLQVGFCCPNVIIQEQSGGIHYNQGYGSLPSGDMFDYVGDGAAIGITDGYFTRSDGPGLGVDIDERQVRARALDWKYPDPVWRLEDGRYADW